MLVRALCATLLLPLLFVSLASAQNFDRHASRSAVSVNGTLRDADGAPVSGVQVELRQMAGGGMTFSAVSSTNGSFEMYNIPAGAYEIVAHGDSCDVRQQVNVGFMDGPIDLRLPRLAGSSAGNNTSVSVAQMKVPEKARNAFDKASQAFTEGKFDEAQKQVSKALNLYPHFAEALTLQGLLFLQQKDYARGQAELESAIQFDPNYATAYLALGALFNNVGHYDDAARTLEHSISISPDLWQGYFEMARAYLGEGLYMKALQEANRAQSLGPGNFAPIHLVKAYAMIPQKLYKDAVRELQAFLSRGPKGHGAEEAQKLLAEAQAAELASEHAGQ